MSSRHGPFGWVPAHHLCVCVCLFLGICECAALPLPDPSGICCCACRKHGTQLGPRSPGPARARTPQLMAGSDLPRSRVILLAPLDISWPCGDLGLQQTYRSLRDWVAQSAGIGWREHAASWFLCLCCCKSCVPFPFPTLPSMVVI
ncbi:hypothetical protein HDV57DRAFT_132827 [Trichoderma longibrachiatum]